jgi:hypothetical protein
VRRPGGQAAKWPLRLALRYPAKPSPAKPSSIIGLRRGRRDGTRRHADNRVIRECRVIDREVGSAYAPPARNICEVGEHERRRTGGRRNFAGLRLDWKQVLYREAPLNRGRHGHPLTPVGEGPKTREADEHVELELELTRFGGHP